MNDVSHLDGHFVLGEGSAPQQLVDAVDGQEARDVGAQVVGDCDSDGVGRDHLHADRRRDFRRRSSASIITTCVIVSDSVLVRFCISMLLDLQFVPLEEQPVSSKTLSE